MNITAGNGAATPTAKVLIYGVSLDVMNKIMRIKWNTTQGVAQNFIQIEAGENDQYSIVYAGAITFAHSDFSGSPEVALVIDSTSQIQHKVTWTEPLSFNGTVDVADAVSQLCQKMGMTFENNEVTATVQNPYMPSSALDQVFKLCESAGEIS